MSDQYEDSFTLSPVSSLGPPLSPWFVERGSLETSQSPGCCCAECHCELPQDVYYAQGLRFCSEGCRCMFLAGGSPEGSVAQDSISNYSLKDACPCLAGDTCCPHLCGESPPMHRDPEFVVTMVRRSTCPTTARCCCVLLNSDKNSAA